LQAARPAAGRNKSQAYVVRRDLARFLVRGGVGWAWRALKNVVGLPLGRPVWFASQDILFRLYLRQLLGGPRLQMTCDMAEFAYREGAGSQASLMMAALNFARVLGVAWCHTPFAPIDHGGAEVVRLTEAWEAFFNLGGGELLAAEASGEVVNFGPATAFHLLNLFVDLRGKVLPDNSLIPLLDPSARREFRRKYRANKPPRSPRGTGRLVVAVHVRRHIEGDADHPYAMDMVRMARTLEAVEAVLRMAGRAWEVRLHSQGAPEDFSAFVRPGVTLFLDADPMKSLADLIDADVAILSRGSFSYAAGVLTEGIVIADPYYPPQDGWLVCDESGAFDAEALLDRLR
jgi:hypothetical protein